jgi:hypothetical protein
MRRVSLSVLCDWLLDLVPDGGERAASFSSTVPLCSDLRFSSSEGNAVDILHVQFLFFVFLLVQKIKISSKNPFEN